MVENITDNIGVLIPSLDPDEKLIILIDKLVNTNLFSHRIVIIDDGTQEQTIFDEIAHKTSDEVQIIHHAENFGKGAALKTGFKYFIEHHPEITGIATLDSDGQHTVADLQKCIALFAQQPHDLTIGSRTFSKDIPFRSRFGNTLTSSLVRLLTGLKLSDTQTGLRVIPIDYAKELLTFSGDRFEFEFDMLLEAKKYHIAIHEQPIETIYIDNNATSHFRVIRDSLSIYLQFFKFSLSSLLSFVIDIAVFALVIHLLGKASFQAIMWATILARLVSSIANYLVNRHLVFEGVGTATMRKYGALVIVQMLLSGYLTHLVSTEIHVVHQTTLLITLMKIFIDFVLFLASYQIQTKLIFVKKE